MTTPKPPPPALREICEQGLTIRYGDSPSPEIRERLEFELSTIARMDRLIVLEAGRIVELGPTASVLGDPQHAHTRALVAARRLTPGARGRTPPAQ